MTTTKTMKGILVCAAAALVLTACGGGGGQPSVPPDPADRSREREPRLAPPSGHYQSTDLRAPASADARHMPIYHDDNRLIVGVDQGRDLSRLPAATERGEFTVYFGQVPNGITRQTIEAYLDQVSDDLHEHIIGFKHGRSPTVAYAGNVMPEDRSRLIRAVQLVNAALPDAYQMQVDAAAIDAAAALNRGSGIVVNFLPNEIEGAWGRTVNLNFNDTPQSVISISSAYGDRGDRQATILLAHELAHAMGLGDHVAAPHNSILRGDRSIYAEVQGIPQPLSLLYPEDRAALQVLYDHSKLDYWATHSLSFVARGGQAAFGVARHNGYAEPWAYGNRPSGDIADNRTLPADATWRGILVGVTPSAEAVAGDVAISINMATLRGRADFTQMERWASRQAPGGAGTGVVWGDGDLSYSIAARGNTFRETGGDAGRLTGVFTGAGHDAAAGTLERSDLSAAFGASR